MIEQISFDEFKAEIDGETSQTIIKSIIFREKKNLEKAFNKQNGVDNPEAERILNFCNYFFQQEEFVGLPNNLSPEDKQFYKDCMKKLKMPQYMLVDFEEANA